MARDYAEYAREVDGRAVNLFKAAQGPMQAYRQLMEAAGRDGALDAKTKELMALAISIVTHCEGCIVYHARAAQRKGATRDETAETIAVAVEMGGGPAAVYGAVALEAFDQFAG